MPKPSNCRRQCETIHVICYRYALTELAEEGQRYAKVQLDELEEAEYIFRVYAIDQAGQRSKLAKYQWVRVVKSRRILVSALEILVQMNSLGDIGTVDCGPITTKDASACRSWAILFKLHRSILRRCQWRTDICVYV